ncbi:MDR family oxidoreductase [Thorsellia anophelis]|uniref:Putative quinone oxidoreductase, YhdH/YhfP family n=1 Tax=Thorsellia anophelis DSM 18579 TaxID=1123402 RepID=A0A1I0EPI2_9GAMM|nr:MDR family oxidoreductase [Thorsellia anophelis]SET47171.1 putative quinone oxidoreductase, YhdH/YhfP family [Thorsellia anophelis DSM 18579]
MAFKALLSSQVEGLIENKIVLLEEEQLMQGDVTVSIEYSTVNYKDALALTGRSPIIRSFPMIPGIDFAGTVIQTSHSKFNIGDKVIANGFELSQTHYGGFAQKARVNGDWLIKIPSKFSTKDAMAIGTAGYTAMLAILALEHGHVSPNSGDILVTGASGGAGSIAIALLTELGFRVIASTGRMEETTYLKKLGAVEVINRQTLSQPGAPISKPRFAGVIDSVGSHTLANAIAQTNYGGVIAAFGLAQGMDLPSSVLPFILRNVTLSGIDSVNAPIAIREKAWARLAQDLDLNKLALTTKTIGLSEVTTIAPEILNGQIRGRTVVDVNL